MKALRLLFLVPFLAFAQGSLTPPGPPGPTMKTLVEVEPRTHITSLPYYITNSGSYYITSDLIAPPSQPAIVVTIGAVSIDLKGFSIVGGLNGITGSGISGVTVRNGTVRQSAGTGIDLGKVSKCQIEHVLVCDNGGNGLSVGAGSIVNLTTATGNKLTGIWTDEGSAVFNCVSQSNKENGIEVTSQCRVSETICDLNGSAASNSGLLATGRGNRLEANNASRNTGVGIAVTGKENLVIKNSACDNTVTDYQIAGGNNYGQIIAGPGANFVNSNPWANFSCSNPGPNGCTSDADCNDNNPCTTDLCDAAAHTCSHNPIPNCGNAVCGNGTIEAGETCDDGNTMSGDGCSATCQTEGQACTTNNDCADTNICTTDTCVGGVCQHTPNNVSCDDGNPCTINDSCGNNGQCTGTPKVCNDNNNCTADSCNPTTGLCQFTPNNGGICNDNSACTINDACSNGQCVGTTVNCNDGNPCTIDNCNPVVGCTHNLAANGSPCPGGTCNNGNCVPENCTSSSQCNDNNPCTTDACIFGSCAHSPNNGAACTDNSACTTNDTCSNGQCVGTAVACNDNNPCTTDSCHPVLGCTSSNLPNGTACPNGTCNNGACQPVGNCMDGIKNGNETDVDCGGSCPPCSVGQMCNTNADCASGLCQNGFCQQNNCPDADMDGYPSAACGGTDCADNNAQVHPGHVELCNGVDDDCDGTIDEGFGTTTCGTGACQNTVQNCVNGQPQNCTPGTPSAEVCNGIDDDCDGQVDEGCSQPVCGNGIIEGGEQCDDGNLANGDGCSNICQLEGCTTAAQCNDNNPCTTDACVAGQCQHTPNTGLCSDNSACTTNDACNNGLCVGTPVTCDDGNPCTSNQCHPQTGCNFPPLPNGTACPNGTCNNGVCQPGNCPDADGDGYTSYLCGGTDCDDGNPQVRPGAVEGCNGVDDNCNGSVDEGFGSVTCGVGACQRTIQACQNGQLQSCTPGSPSAEICNNIDDNCDGQVDNNLGTITCGTGACQRNVPACVNGQVQTCTPGNSSPEICNGVDDDCDGMTDEGNPGGGALCNTGQLGICSQGTTVCQNAMLVCVQNQQPSAEVCDGTDNNCNGQSDEGDPGGGAACNTGLPGVCAAGTRHCVNGNQTCTQNVQPSAEVCNGQDDNCNGSVDEGLGNITCGIGACMRTVASCVNGQAQTCMPGTPVTEICNNGIDDDCDGQVDEGCIPNQ